MSFNTILSLGTGSSIEKCISFIKSNPNLNFCLCIDEIDFLISKEDKVDIARKTEALKHIKN